MDLEDERRASFQQLFKTLENNPDKRSIRDAFADAGKLIKRVITSPKEVLENELPDFLKQKDPVQENEITVQAAETQRLDLIVCQDNYDIQENSKKLNDVLRAQGHNVNIQTVEHARDLKDLLKTRYSQGKPPPTDIFLDVSGGNGSSAALDVIRYLEEKYPDAPLPAINFCSCDMGMAVDAACELRAEDDAVITGAVDRYELEMTSATLKGKRQCDFASAETRTLRDILNARLGISSLPMDYDENHYNAKKLKDLSAIPNSGVFSAWRKRKAFIRRSYRTSAPLYHGFVRCFTLGLLRTG